MRSALTHDPRPPRSAAGHVGSACGRTAFSLVELVLVVAIVGLLAALLLPVLAQTKARAQRIACANHLRQVGVALQGFSHENGDRFPARVLAAKGETLALAAGAAPGLRSLTLSPRPFQVLSNELNAPAVLICPADRRNAAPSFAALEVANLSYFTGLDASPADPLSLVAGDHNITNHPTRPAVDPKAPAELRFGWTRALHNQRGNVLLADGHVEQWRGFSMSAGPGQGPSAPPSRHPPVQPARGKAPAAKVPAPADDAGGARSPWNPGQTPGAGSVRGAPDSQANRAAEALAAASPIAPPTRPPTSTAGGFGPTGVRPLVALEEWDTPMFRKLLILAKLAYLLCLLWAITVFVVFLLRARARRGLEAP